MATLSYVVCFSVGVVAGFLWGRVVVCKAY